MFKRCFDDGEFNQAIGIALESRRLDVVEKAIKLGDSKALLNYVTESSMTLVQNLDFRNKVLQLLVKLYKSLDEPDYVNVALCLIHLNDTGACADLLQSLVNKKDDVRANSIIPVAVHLTPAKFHLLMSYQIAFDLEDNATQEFLHKVTAALPNIPVAVKDENSMEVDQPSGDMTAGIYKNIKTILSGELSIKLYLEFLHRNNHSDLLILKNTKV